MSYILEALKKAESERRLGSVPDMHAQPLSSAPVEAARTWRNPYAWSVLGVTLLIMAAVLLLKPWQTSLRSDSGTTLAQKASPEAAQIDASPKVGNLPPAASAPALPPMASAPVPERSPVVRPKNESRAEPVKPKPVPAPAKKKRERETVAEPASAAPAAAPKPAKREDETRAATVAKAPEAGLPRLHELPGNIQREIPALTVGGYIYSSVPAERSLLINNRLLREGGEVAPGLVLEEMLPKEAVLAYKGHRYRVPYR